MLTAFAAEQGLLGRCTFQECAGFDQVSIPGSVKAIADQAFNQCANLRKVTLAEGVEYISDRAFANCQYLREVIIPESVSHIAGNAFENDEKLTIMDVRQILKLLEQSALPF
ncbi:MAG: leucine-rich repeat domain-containing protein [Oscillospiraceae bacterium]|nr:leucine-rich repeat domain-containing protein [Oscillospiraceae bacterium]